MDPDMKTLLLGPDECVHIESMLCKLLHGRGMRALVLSICATLVFTRYTNIDLAIYIKGVQFPAIMKISVNQIDEWTWTSTASSV